MSFYIRDISNTDRYFFETNTNLLISEEYKPEDYTKLFKSIFVEKSDSFERFKGSQRKYEIHNKDLAIVNSIEIDLSTISSFVLDRKYDSVELLIPESYLFENIDLIIEQIYSYFLDSEISVGVLISNPNYLIEHKDYIDKYGFFISKYIPQAIDIVKQETIFQATKDFDIEGASGVLKNCKIKLPSSPKLRKMTVTQNFELQESFKEKLIKYLNKSKKTNVEVYTKGGITRKVFSKILSDENYNPKKDTICCLIIGMELCLDDALDLLNAAGYTLSNSLLGDVIIKKHITKKEFNINLINAELDEHGLTVIGWKPRDD